MENEKEYEVRQLNNMGDVSKKMTMNQIVDLTKKGYFLFVDKKFVDIDDLSKNMLKNADEIHLKLSKGKERLLAPKVVGG